MGSRCVKFGVIALSHSLILVTGSSTWHLMAKNSLRIWKKRMVALYKDGVGYKNIAKTLKLSCGMVVKTILRFNRTGSTQNKSHHGQQKKLSHMFNVISRCCVWEIDVWVLPALLQRLKGWGVSLSVLRPNAAHCIKLVCIAVVPEGSLCKQFAEDKQTKDMDFWKHVLWSDEAKINLFGSDAVKRVCWQPGEEYKDK